MCRTIMMEHCLKAALYKVPSSAHQMRLHFVKVSFKCNLFLQLYVHNNLLCFNLNT